MSAIKRFFEQKKLNAKFKTAGTGHQLNKDKEQSVASSSSSAGLVLRQQPSTSAHKAGAAALSRFQGEHSKTKKPTSTATSWKQKDTGGSTEIDIARMKKEMLTFDQEEPKVKHQTVKISASSDLAVTFVCPLCPVVLPKPDIFHHLKDCLSKDLKAEPLMISITMIHSLNENKTQVQGCINILSKYLQNIIDHKGEEKYWKIRKGNKVFQEKAAVVLGTHEFLVDGCGYMLEKLSVEGDSIPQEFYILSKDLAEDDERLLVAKTMLAEAEGLELCLNRNLHVYCPSVTAHQMQVPPSFYIVSSDEVKREQESKQNEVEKAQMLQTRAMRENNTKVKRIYKYLILRFRFPDGILLQGTFSVQETLSDVKVFIKENLLHDWIPFRLVDSIGQPFKKDSDSVKLTNLNLAPAALINFVVDADILVDMKSSQSNKEVQYLKDEILVLTENLK